MVTYEKVGLHQAILQCSNDNNDAILKVKAKIALHLASVKETKELGRKEKMSDMYNENDARLKAIKRIILLMIICFAVAFVSIGLPFYMKFLNQNKEYVKLESKTLPILMTPTLDKDSQFYFITDVNDQVYIVNLSNETFKSITAMLDMKTGKLSSVYELEGIAVEIENDVRQLAFSNSFKVFKNNEINSDTFSEYLGEYYIKENFVSDRVVTLYKTSAFIGLFFLVLAFGYLVPVLIKVNRGEFGISEERKIMQSLEKHLPEREILTAGVSGSALEVRISTIFKGCIYDGEKIIPSENDEMLRVNKSKVVSFGVYVGITPNYLIFVQQEENKWYYDIDKVRNADEKTAIEVSDCILLKDMGVCFPIAEIQSCVMKKIWMGAVRCTVTMKNGSFLKFQLPKIDGLPHYEEYRKAILDCLSSSTVK